MKSTASEPSPFLLETRSLTKLYPDGDVHALEDVTVGFHEREYVAVMGPSGSGKSTLLRLLVRLYDVDDGQGEMTADALLEQAGHLWHLARDKLAAPAGSL